MLFDALRRPALRRREPAAKALDVGDLDAAERELDQTALRQSMELGVDRLTGQAGERGDVGLGQLEHDARPAGAILMPQVGEIGELSPRPARRRSARGTPSRSACRGRSARARAAQSSDSSRDSRSISSSNAASRRTSTRASVRATDSTPVLTRAALVWSSTASSPNQVPGDATSIRTAGPASPSVRSPPVPRARRRAPRGN